MPSSITVSLISLGAVLTSVSDIAGVVVAALGVVWEIFLSLLAGAEA